MRYFLIFITISITLTACLTQKHATNTDNGDDENGESALENASLKALLESIEEGFDNDKGDLLFLKVRREPDILGKEITIVV